MRVLILNAQSIKSPGKPAQLQTLIQSTNADIVIGSESWFPPDFTCYRNDRSRSKGGGVFLLVSNQFDSYEPEELKAGDECELVWAKLKVQGSKDLYISSFYRPPDNTTLNTWTSSRNSYCAYQHKMVLICGSGVILTWQT